jgi:uncharacterized membrane protein YfhO
MHTSTDGDAWLVLSDTYYPGWKAFVDGQQTPLLRGDVLFRAVPIPAGEHDVQLHFEPASVKVGLAISLVVLGSLLGCLGISSGRGRPRRTT